MIEFTRECGFLWNLDCLLVGLVIQRFAIYKLGMQIIPFAKDLNGATSWYNFPGFSFQLSIYESCNDYLYV